MQRTALPPNKTILLANQMVVNYRWTSSGDSIIFIKGVVAVPNQYEPWLLDLPKGVKKTGPYQQMAVKDAECATYNFPITPYHYNNSTTTNNNHN